MELLPALTLFPFLPRVTVTFVDKDGTEHKVLAPVGKHLLEVAHDNDIELEGRQECVSAVPCNLVPTATCRPLGQMQQFQQQEQQQQHNPPLCLLA